MRPPRPPGSALVGWLAVASVLLSVTPVAAQHVEMSPRSSPLSSWRTVPAAAASLLEAPSQIQPPRGTLQPRIGEAQVKGLKWGAGLGALVGLAIGVSVAANRECGMDCMLGTPVLIPMYGLVGGAMAGGAIGFVVGSVVDHRRASRAYVSTSVRLGLP